MTYKEGIAQGFPQISTDTIFFRYKDKTWETPTYGVVGRIAHFNGLHYEAAVKDLKKLKRKHHG